MRLKGWQGAAALAVGFAMAGVPKPAVPLDADDARAPLRVDDADRGAAETLTVNAVLRLDTRPDPAVEAIIAT
ncbi:hypothetical protein ACFOMD_06865 [Sphingoaurantiacus capsulatus]|uniref:Uncharacterized protein n=1 Tax=Sphingoaurantiacus capsulatus TaxID=1771310 RepID=A0ABV7XAG1_9SPHN